MRGLMSGLEWVFWMPDTRNDVKLVIIKRLQIEQLICEKPRADGYEWLSRK